MSLFSPITPPTEHGSEIFLLYGVAVIIGVLAGIGIYRSGSGFDPSAYLVVLTLIVGAVTKRWDTRSIDRMGQSLANAPPAQPPAGTEGDKK